MSSNKIIIYDDSCPLCTAYTKGFVRAGMIREENRKNFTTIDNDLLNLIDTKRCINEIPVIDSETKEVWYGIDALAEILQTKIPFTKKTIALKFIRKPIYLFYKLISYNRRVIVATKTNPGNFDCTPDFNYKYRFVFMFLFLLFNTAMLIPIHEYILPKSLVSISLKELQVAHFVLITLNIIIAFSLRPKKAFEYLGQANMLALTTILLSFPLLLLNKYHLVNYPAINNIYLLALTIFVFKEYKRRMDFAGIIKEHPIIVRINIGGLLSFLFYLVY